MAREKKKRPHTLMQRIRSSLLDWLLDDPRFDLSSSINSRGFAELVKGVVGTTTDDNGEAGAEKQ